MKKRNVPDGKKIICSVIAEEGILHLKDTGVFCAISRAKNIYACGMELDKYITKIKAGKMYKYMQTRELFSRGEKHEKQDVTYGG